MKKRVLFAWSSGKDSALALHELKKNPDVEVAALLTTVTEGYDRISMHGVRRNLLSLQAEALGYPLDEVVIPQNCTNEIYEQRMNEAVRKYKDAGVETAAFGDIFLQDVREYREERMNRAGMSCIFPLWGRSTKELSALFCDQGFKAIVVCVDTHALAPEFTGRRYDRSFISDLPAGIDPCGENGEFHTFVYDGPVFTRPVKVTPGEKVLRDNRFSYCDLG